MAIQARTIENYKKAIQSLLGSLSRTEFKKYSMNKLITEYKLYPGITKILIAKGWIEKRGTSINTEYRAKKRYDEFDPIHAKEIVKACNDYTKELKKKRINQGSVKVTKFNIINTISNLVSEAEQLGENTVKIVYRKRTDHNDVVKSLEEAVSKGLNLSLYEKHVIPTSPRELFVMKINGDAPLTNADIKKVEAFARILKSLKLGDGTNGFAQRSKAIANKIKNGKIGQLEKVQLIKELCNLYIVYNKVPSSNFTHLSVYNEMINKKL